MLKKAATLPICLFLGLCLTANTLQAQKLYSAVATHDYALVKQLLEKGANPDKHAKSGLFPLWRAAADNDTAMVRLLLQYKANPNLLSKNESPSPALVIPAQEGYLEVMKILADYGADLNINMVNGQTAIRVAARNGHLNVLSYLIEKGMDLDDHRARDGATPLEGAAAKGHLHLVQYLVEKGANVNHRDAEGDTPIGEAATHGYKEVVEYLLAHGADPALKNNQGYDAAYRAKIGGQSLLANWLTEKMSAGKGH